MTGAQQECRHGEEGNTHPFFDNSGFGQKDAAQ
jgi:hypothetical protein